jgi:hypothetical protein
MKTRKGLKARFAICVNNSEYPASLELHKIYRVIPDEDARKDGDLRIVDESGDDYLYPTDYFLLIDIPRSTAQSLNRSFARATREVGALRRRSTVRL